MVVTNVSLSCFVVVVGCVLGVSFSFSFFRGVGGGGFLLFAFFFFLFSQGVGWGGQSDPLLTSHAVCDLFSQVLTFKKTFLLR